MKTTMLTFLKKQLTTAFCFLFLMPIFLSSQTATDSLQLADSIPLADSLHLTDSLKSAFEHFERKGVLDIILTTDFKNLIKEKNKSEYQEAQMAYYTKDSMQIVRDVKVRARGNMRRRICDIPPIKLKIKKDKLKEEGILPFNTLKFVMPCKSMKIYSNFILKEYLAYQLLNILTDYSFKTQLIRLHYNDTSGKINGKTKYGFIIENEDELAARHDCKIADVTRCHPDKLAREQATLVYLFEYMIANTDWKVEYIHNLKLLYKPGTTDFIPVPYDFDYAGIINTPYAVPQAGTPFETVTERYYGGACRTKEELEEAIAIFKTKKEKIINYCQEFEYLDKKERKKMVKYLESFFKTIGSSKAIKREFMVKC